MIYKKLNNKGQISVELLFLISFTIILAVILSNTVSESYELNLAMEAARQGACEGISSNGLAIYPKDSYDNYSKDYKKYGLTNKKNIKIIKITESNKGKDSFNKTRLQLKVYASSPEIKTKEERESAGDRINYNLRKSITNAFKSENITNRLFNPAYSNRYSFTTANVEWV